MLSLKQLQDVCLAFSNDSRKCRYCAVDEDDPSKYFCMKKSKDRDQIDAEINDEIDDMKKRGLDPYKQNHPLGDNCLGYPILKHITQGYDQN